MRLVAPIEPHPRAHSALSGSESILRRRLEWGRQPDEVGFLTLRSADSGDLSDGAKFVILTNGGPPGAQAPQFQQLTP